MTNFLEADVLKTGQEAFIVLEASRAAKWKHENLRGMLEDKSTDEESKHLLRQQIKNGLLALNKIDQEEQVHV